MLQHIAIIMDGNGRWAEARHLPRTEGHKQGAIAAKKIVRACGERGIKHLTLYTFSAENWKRPETEISDLMNLLRFYLDNEFSEIIENNVRFNVIGDLSPMDVSIRKLINKSIRASAKNTGLQLHLALSYGGRQEIVRAARELARDFLPNEITEEKFSKYLYTTDIPDPDLLIRTGGEKRLSNFLLWQCAYTEFYFTPILWPDFGPDFLDDAIAEFTRRERRFGMTQQKKAV